MYPSMACRHVFQAVGDISLSNILDDSSSFKTNSEQKSPVSGPSSILPIQVDMTSNDGFMKHNDVSFYFN